MINILEVDKSNYDTIFYILLPICIILFIVYIYRQIKKKNYIRENGYYYNKVVELNNKYKFENYRKKITIHHYTKSKKTLANLDFDNVILYYIENNIGMFDDNYHILKKNKELYSKYYEDFVNIIEKKHEYTDEIVDKKTFKDIDHFIKFEQKMINKIKIKDNFKLLVHVLATYTSPKGRNSYYKTGDYNFYNIENCYEQLERKKEYQISSQFQRSLMTDSLRYNILKRDNFRCQICGATASDGAKLHVDHIIPVSKGGKTTPDNLQTLCERCNMGKSNKL